MINKKAGFLKLVLIVVVAILLMQYYHITVNEAIAWLRALTLDQVIGWLKSILAYIINTVKGIFS